MNHFFLKTTILFVMLYVVACQADKNKKLPILGKRETVEKTLDGKIVTDTLYQAIPTFRFLNQDSVYITDKDFKGAVYIADFFFTSCPSICPTMHRNMLNLYKQFKGNPQVKFLSHSIDDKYDTPSVLKKYAKKLGVTGMQWQFVYGDKAAIYTLAEKHYLVAVAEDGKMPGGYVHQGSFVLVDKEKRLRGAYDGTDAKQVEQLAKDIKILLAEYKR